MDPTDMTTRSSPTPVRAVLATNLGPPSTLKRLPPSLMLRNSASHCSPVRHRTRNPLRTRCQSARLRCLGSNESPRHGHVAEEHASIRYRPHEDRLKRRNLRRTEIHTVYLPMFIPGHGFGSECRQQGRCSSERHGIRYDCQRVSQGLWKIMVTESVALYSELHFP